MPLDTLQVRAGQLYTVLMSFVERESFDILVGSRSGEGLEAWRRLHKRWDPLTTGRARGLLREILSLGRAVLAELQGAEQRQDLMRRYTHKKRRSEWPAPHACRGHQNGSVGDTSSDTDSFNGRDWARTKN